MRTRSSEDERTIQHLLGTLSEEAQSSFEQDVLATQESFEHVLAIEDELMYEYLKGELPSGERRLFVERYLVSGEDKRKETFARVLLDWTADRMKVFKPLFEPWKVLQFATAALAVCTVAFSLSLYLESRQMRTLVSQALSQKPVVAPQTAAIPPPPAVLFFLESGLSRSAGGPKRLRIPAAAGDVRLRLDGKYAELGRAYLGVLRTAGGEEVWSTNGLLFQREPNGVVLSTELPAGIILNGEYELILRPSGRSGEDLDYHFTVSR